ncbi:MAG: hypothetical protein RLZZ86_2690, partial [Cyanobacteriota bacterium]
FRKEIENKKNILPMDINVNKKWQENLSTVRKVVAVML